MKTSLRLVVLFVALFGSTMAAHAAPITFEFSGTASGKLGASTFTDALVTVTSNANTVDVISQTADFDGDGTIETIYALALALTNVNIAGLGTVTILDPTAIYAFPGFTNVDPGEEIFHQPVVVMGTLDSPPSLDSFTGIAAVAGAPYAGYTLSTALGPIGSIGGIGHPPALAINTSGGSLFFDSNAIGDSRGVFTARVPEPSSLSLLASGILSLAGLTRRKRG